MATNDLATASEFHPGKPWTAGHCTCRRDPGGRQWFACRHSKCEAQAKACGGYCSRHFAYRMNLPSRPEVVVLCGSTRFSEMWEKVRYDLTLDGKIVLTIGCDTKSDDGLGITPEQKAALDDLHKRKIDMADRVLVLNVGGYIGDSTRSEIAHAEMLDKPIDYLEPLDSQPDFQRDVAESPTVTLGPSDSSVSAP